MNPFPVIIGVGALFWLCWLAVIAYRICGIIDAPWLLLLSPAILVALAVGVFVLRCWTETRRQRRQTVLVRRVILEGKLCIRRRQEQQSLGLHVSSGRRSVTLTVFPEGSRTVFRDRPLS